ncbi:Nitroreductase [Clostridium sp. DSM 8431]|uniref:nitroreductase family protein n=1 Tax=Clostridium sp. DSM 8431 TaxID=1761781 RepID=UPI0008E6972B|nr:nitroreductase family protein [Clostridium sp. DSM 8431]SFU84888.1 Nitroreductase [Clostridium sp. DSM 8431]
MFKVDSEKCIGCMQCIKDCPTHTISLVDGKACINPEGCLKCGHCVAICPVAAVSTDDFDMTEVKEYDKETFTINPERLENFIKFRRSVRRFKDKEVEKEKIEKIIEVGRFTQTSTNNQDVSYTVVTGDKLNELKDIIHETLCKRGQYILDNLTPETKYLERYAKAWIKMYESYKENPKNDGVFFNAPVAIFVKTKTPINGGLASSNMDLMVDALGLGTFFSGFSIVAAKDNKEMLDFIGADSSDEVISCLVIGYPDVKYRRTTPRKKAEINWL